jgi:rRNA biogenesis protein RRP5
VQNLVKGSLVLGEVCAINDLDIALALPNNLVGHVSLTAISDRLTDRIQAQNARENSLDSTSEGDEDENDIDLKSLFELGQYLRAYVVSTVEDSSAAGTGKARRRIELSLQPELANSGLSAEDLAQHSTVMAAVASVEDHGYVMDLDIADSDLRGFLSRKHVDSSIEEERMQPGSVLLCSVSGKSGSGKIVQLTTMKENLGNTKNWPSQATTINTFVPGTVAEVLISDISSRGVSGKVMGHLDATADLVHSTAGPDGTDLESTYKIGARVKTRVICTFPAANDPKVGVSVIPHILSMESKTVEKEGNLVRPTAILANSSLVEACVVRKVEPEVGLFVDVGVEGVSGFVHISRIKDGKVDALYEHSGPYKVGSTHPGRVLGYNGFDGTFTLSLEKSILEQPYLSIEDVPVGEVVNGVIEKTIVKEQGLVGVIVKMAQDISGLVNETHLADVHLQHPEKKFREGMKVKARVLSVDPSRHQIRLTLKKTLVNSEAPAIKSFDELSVGMQVPGTIVNIVQAGAIVQFYGKLRGFLPVQEMSEAYIRDPKEHFRVGQVVNVHVLAFNPDEDRLIVSCKDPSAFSLDKQVALKNLKIGDVVSAKVTQKTEDDVFVELADNSLRAVLPVGHLTDKSNNKNQSALKKIHVGQTLSDLIILDKDDGKRSITLSRKPSLVEASKEKQFLSKIEDAKVGKLVHGFIRNITATAAFVQFGGRLNALLPKSLMPRDIQQTEGFGLFRSQSLTVKIVSVDLDQQRLVVAIPSVEVEAAKATPKSKDSSRVAVNAVDESITSMDDIRIGMITKARVAAIKETQVNVRLADNIQGRIDVSEVYDEWDAIADPKRPLRLFQPKQTVKVRVLGIHDAKNHRFLPISHRSTQSVLELSTKPSQLLEGKAPQPLSYDNLEVGSYHLGFVNNVGRDCLWLNLSPNVRGRVKLTEASDDLSELQNLEKSFQVGSAIRVRVLAVDAENKRLDLSARSTGSSDKITWDNIEKDMVVVGRVTKISDRQLMVKLSESVAGPVHLVDLADDYDEANPVKYSKMDFIRVSIVEVDKPNKKLRLSTRPSRILNSTLPVKDKEITKHSKIDVGDVVRGFVRNVADKGLFVNLGGDVTALAMIKDLSDKFIKEWKNDYQVDQIVKGRVISASDGRIGLSLKASVVDSDYKPPITIFDLKEGQDVTGKVRKVEDYGAFIDIDGSANVTGLCHRSEMAEKPVADARKLYTAGDIVKARVLKIDLNQKKLSLGLKSSYFGEADDSDMDVDVDQPAGAALGSDFDTESEDEDLSIAEVSLEIFGTDNDSEAESDVDMPDAPADAVFGLGTGGFDWSGIGLDAEDGGAPVESRDGSAKKIKEKRTSQRQEDKTAQLDANGPQTGSDYERLLLGQPDNWQLWVSYMAFQMQVSELAKARDVAERALKAINMREETAKLNIWIAYLNLEVAYGTQDTVDGIFKRACTYNDEQVVFEKLVSIYIRSGNHKVSCFSSPIDCLDSMD